MNIKSFFPFLFLLCCTINISANSWDNEYPHFQSLYNQGELDKALSIAITFAKQGNADAQNAVGCIYLDKNEILQARQWFEKAIDKGNVQAMFNMGLSFDGINTYTIPSNLQNLAKAKLYYKKAMDATYSLDDFRFNSYMNYASIIYQQENKKNEAINLLHSLLRTTEHAGIRRLLGAMYVDTECPYEAFKMYRIAAEYGDMEAMYLLGRTYMNPNTIKGLNISQDNKAAIEWFTKIAEINDPNFKDSFGSGTGHIIRYLTILYSDLYYITCDEKYLTQSLRWGSRNMGDIMIDNTLFKMYQEGLSDSKMYQSYSDWTEHLIEKYSVDSDIDIEVPINYNHRNNTYVLIIANEDYEYETKVPYASRDGNIFFKYMNQSLSIPKENIHLITNASLNKMNYEINWLREELDTHPDSKAIVYYAGHGLPSENNSSSYLLPIDGYAKNVNSGIDINEFLSKISATDNPILVILDACFSGSKRDGQMLVSSRGVAIKQPKPSLNSNTIIISACSGTETAYAYEDQQHGLLTYFLLKALKNANGNISLGNLADDVINSVKKVSMDVNNKIQTPSITVGEDLLSTWRTIKF